MMKQPRALIFALWVFSLCAGSQEVTPTRNPFDYVTLGDFKPPGKTNDVKTTEQLSGLNAVLMVYRMFTNLELIIDSRASKSPHQVTFTMRNMPRAQVVKEMEQTLIEQAGIVITRLDGKRASVTYNDALPIIPSKKSANPAKP